MTERERVERPRPAGTPLRDKDGQRRVPLSNESINKTLVLLANILDSAVERGGLETNPARGKRRRLKAPRPTRRVLEPDELTELLAHANPRSRKSAPVGPPNCPVVHKSGPQTQNQPPEDDLKLPDHTRKAPDFQGFPEWARLGSNQRPLACEASALPLSYAPGTAPVYAPPTDDRPRC